MRILLLGSFDFADHLGALGHEVFTCGPDSAANLCLMDQDPDWRTIEKLAKKQGLSFEAVLVCDNVGSRCLPTGIAHCPAVTAFYGIDAPLNEFWQRPYARLFDVAFLDQPEQAQALAEIHGNAHWLPLGIDPEKYAGPAPQTVKPGVAFVGVVNPAVRPKRSALLERISHIAPPGNQRRPPGPVVFHQRRGGHVPRLSGRTERKPVPRFYHQAPGGHGRGRLFAKRGCASGNDAAFQRI